MLPHAVKSAERPDRVGSDRLMRDGGGLSFLSLCQALRDMGNPISRQHLGFIGLAGAVQLLDLLGTALYGGFAILGSNRIWVDQLLSESRLVKNQGSDKKQVVEE
jgi:hypothetical protein